MKWPPWRLQPRSGQVLASHAMQGIYVPCICPFFHRPLTEDCCPALHSCLSWLVQEGVAEAVRAAYELLSQAPLKVLVATYFERAVDNLAPLFKLPVAAIHVDLVRAPEQLPAVLGALGRTSRCPLASWTGATCGAPTLDKCLQAARAQWPCWARSASSWRPPAPSSTAPTAWRERPPGPLPLLLAGLRCGEAAGGQGPGHCACTRGRQPWQGSSRRPGLRPMRGPPRR